MTDAMASPNFRGDLGDGLIRRWSTPADVEKLAHLMGTVFRDSADEPPNVRMIDQAHLMMAPGYPYMGPGDFAVVEDTSKPDSPLVACTALWRHQWSYAGLPFGVGRPEYVAANADYRKRGLVRAIFEMLHARSAAEGHLLQAITGIPYFYRQFGYEYVLDLEGRRTTYLSAIPNKKGDEPDLYSLRPATLDDIPHLMALYDQGRAKSLVWYEGSEEFWRFMVGYWQNPAISESRRHHLDDGHAAANDGRQRRYRLRLSGCGYAARRWRVVDPAYGVLSPDQFTSRTALAFACFA